MVVQNLINKILGDPNTKVLKKLKPIVEQVNHHFKIYEAQKLDQFGIQAQTQQFRDRIQSGETLDQILPEAYGLVKYACQFLVGQKWIVREEEVEWNMVPFDVQILGGIVLHKGNIAEMKTGEGKTLVCTMPAYLNALSGKGVFVITVNDYLAQRDAEWMGGLYTCLGLTTGIVLTQQPSANKAQAYQCDIIYGTNNEVGFDYLRDNMATQKEQIVQRELNYAIIDEVDSILIDEARTPLIISAPAEESTEKYLKYSQLITKLSENIDYNIDEKAKAATLTEAGIKKMEQFLNLENIYTEAGFQEVHHIEQSLKAEALFKRDRDYVIQNDEIVIVDDFTGRLMPGRRYSHGLHQAIEAKENVTIKRESRTLATITFQNFFRLFNKLAGMTGTAKTEEEEFYKIYGLETVVIPTNKTIARHDLADNIYRNKRGKYKAIVETTKEHNQLGRPVLIGTVSVEQSELLSDLFNRAGIKHNVLNAKQHEREAEIVAKAGQKGAVTIATNMAGRGTDIKIDQQVRDLNGLVIIGTERHESRRIDNQLRGRAGRQGDPGTTQFYVSMEDDLMRIFGGEKVKSMMNILNMPEETAITNGLITKALESAQKRVEGHNFDIRKHVVEYDDVMNYHREIVYKLRRKILFGEDLKNDILALIEKETEKIIENNKSENESYNYKEIHETVNAIHKDPQSPISLEELEKQKNYEEMFVLIRNYLWSSYENLESKLPEPKIFREVERQIFLRTIDTIWIEHIDIMQDLRKSVALEAYGQRNPLIIYKDLAYHELQSTLNKINTSFLNTIFKVNLNVNQSNFISSEEFPSNQLKTNSQAIEANLTKSNSTEENKALSSKKVGRNENCSCGSGKKYKKCHGK